MNCGNGRGLSLWKRLRVTGIVGSRIRRYYGSRVQGLGLYRFSWAALVMLMPSALALADGINITNAAQLNLLTQPLNSAAVIAAGYKAPYAGYPATLRWQSLRPFPQFTTIPALWSPLGNDWYDSLQSKATKRLSHGLDFTGAFTWQKELQLGADGGAINDFASREANKSISPNSVPLELVLSVTYQTPVWGPNRLVRNVTSNWSLGAILRYQSGLPILVPAVSSNALNNGIFQTTYANRVPGQPLFLQNLNCGCFDPTKTLVLNPAAWSNGYGDVWQLVALLQRLPVGPPTGRIAFARQVFHHPRGDAAQDPRHVLQPLQPDLPERSRVHQCACDHDHEFGGSADGRFRLYQHRFHRPAAPQRHAGGTVPLLIQSASGRTATCRLVAPPARSEYE